MIKMTLTKNGIMFGTSTTKTKSKTKRPVVKYEIKIAFGMDDHGEDTEYYDLTDIDTFIADYQQYIQEYNYVYCEIIDNDGEYYDIDSKLPNKKANKLLQELYVKMQDLDLL